MTTEAPKKPKVLVILHQHCSSPGRIGRILTSLGYALDVRRPRFDDPLPETLEGHAGAVIFGGSMSVNDSEAWIRREIDWIGVALKEEKPFLGVCLGAQMLARHLGHRVCVHPEGRVEVGYYPIHPTEQGHRVCGRRFPDRVYQWHREGFDLPNGADLLASGQDFEAQAFRYGPCAYGFQFHPEVTLPMICRWSARRSERLVAPGARPLHRHLAGWLRHDGAIARWSDAFLRSWVEAGEPRTAAVGPTPPHGAAPAYS
ncbi:glutamine amidotransferase [Methylocella sp.]|uniref:glutamine amidotransferase n=1 Tax=Methylocella sp. TaxID=1978226 RepID=UPI0035B125CC